VRYEQLTSVLTKAIQEIATISGTFEQNLIAWLASASNGIHDLFAGTVHAHQFCAQKSDGTEVCVTGDQLAALLAADNPSPLRGSTRPRGHLFPSGIRDTEFRHLHPRSGHRRHPANHHHQRR